MIKVIGVILILVIIATGAFFFYQSSQKNNQQPTNITTETPIAIPTASIFQSDDCGILERGNTDVPPLYKEDITWQQPKITEYEVPLGDEGPRKMQGCLVKSTYTTDKVSVKIIGKYDDELLNRGWETIISAGGSYSSTDSYKNTDRYFVVRRYPSNTEGKVGNPEIIVELFYSN